VMEYAGGGDLLRLIKKKGKLDEGDTKYIAQQCKTKTTILQKQRVNFSPGLQE